MSKVEIVGISSTTEDHQPLIQRALDAVDDAGGGVVYVPDGEHLLLSSLLIGDNTHLKLGPGCTLVRQFGNTNETAATIRNKDFTNGNANIRVTGGTIRAHSSIWEGKHLAFVKVTYIAVDAVRITEIHNAWNAYFGNCKYGTVSNVVIDSGVTNSEDGLHFIGCQRFAVTNCDIRCGDDCIALVNEDLGEETETTDFAISNCYLRSYAANAIRIQVGNESPLGIRRIVISNIAAQIGPEDSVASDAGTGLVIEGSGDSDSISDIQVDQMFIDGRRNNNVGGALLTATRLRLSKVIFYRPKASVIIRDCSDVELVDCVVFSPQNSGQACLLIADVANSACSNLRIRGGAYYYATTHAIIVGYLSAVTGFEISNAYLEGNNSTTTNGIYVRNGSGGIVCNNKISRCVQWGIKEESPSAGNVFMGNLLAGNGSGGLTGLQAPASQGIRNAVELSAPTDDSGGFRQTIDGWSIGNSATAGGIEIPRFGSAPLVGRYRAVRTGWITGLVLENTADFTGSGATVTADVYLNGTGIADNPGGPSGYSLTLNTGSLATDVQNRGAFVFFAGDEIYLRFTSSGSPPAGELRCAFEIET